MKEFIRQVRLWRIRRKITQAIRHIQQAQKLREAHSVYLENAETYLRASRAKHNP